jgi:hypothetical protein
MGVIAPRHLALEVQAVYVREFDVKNQAGRNIGFRMCNVLSGGAESARAHIEAPKELDQRFADSLVVVHDENDVVGLHQRDGTALRRCQARLRIDLMARLQERLRRQSFG